MKAYLALVTLFVLSACGSPFDEDYWDDDLSEREREDTNNGRLSASLSPVSTLSFGTGEAIVDLDGNAASMRIEMQDVPQNIVQGQVLVPRVSLLLVNDNRRSPLCSRGNLHV